MTNFFARHEALLDRAIAAVAARDYFSAYPESASPKVYGETAKADGDAAFEALIGQPFPFDDKHPNERLVGAETSPFGKPLGVRYPTAAVETLIAASASAGEAWGGASVDARAGVLIEALSRLNAQSFLIADAVQHTSGQPWGMAFQAGGPHAQDRGLEAIAYAVAEMNRVPREARWEKPQGKGEPIRLAKRFRIMPRGIAVEIGCATFPTWNLYPGLFASLATGNSVIVKPHPAAILPAAITLKILREVLAEAGFDPNVALLAADEPSAPVAKQLVQHTAVKIVDFTGGPAFGSWLRHSLEDKLLYTEEAGVNAIVVDFDRELPRHVRQYRLLPVALLRANVHSAAECLRSQGWDRDERRTKAFRRGGEGHRGRRRSPACGAGARPGVAWRDSGRRDAREGQGLRLARPRRPRVHAGRGRSAKRDAAHSRGRGAG